MVLTIRPGSRADDFMCLNGIIICIILSLVDILHNVISWLFVLDGQYLNSCIMLSFLIMRIILSLLKYFHYLVIILLVALCYYHLSLFID